MHSNGFLCPGLTQKTTTYMYICVGNKSPAGTPILQSVTVGQASKYKNKKQQNNRMLIGRHIFWLAGRLAGWLLEGGYAKWAALTNALARAKKVPTQQSYSRVELDRPVCRLRQRLNQ